MAFRSPLFLLGLSSSGNQAGYIGALPTPFLAGSIDSIQAGFVSPIPLLGLNAGEAIIVEAPAGNAGTSAFHEDLREEEEILGIIQAFLHTRG